MRGAVSRSRKRYSVHRDYMASLSDRQFDYAVYDARDDSKLGRFTDAQPVAVFAQRKHARLWADQMNEHESTARRP